MSIMLRRNTTSDPSATEGQPTEAETQMRRALGLLPGAGPRGRTRNGDGPLVEHRGDRQAGSSVNRIAAAEAALAAERQAREQLARQLRDAEGALHEAQTQRGHAELARDEAVAALAAERTAREAAEEQARQLAAAAPVPRLEPAAPPVAPPPPGKKSSRKPPAAPTPSAPAKRRGRPPGNGGKAAHTETRAPKGDAEQSEAVEWWVPGWQERY